MNDLLTQELSATDRQVHYYCINTAQQTINTLGIDAIIGLCAADSIHVKVISSNYSAKAGWYQGLKEVLSEQYEINTVSPELMEDIFNDDRVNGGESGHRNSLMTSWVTAHKLDIHIFNIGGGQKSHTLKIYDLAIEYLKAPIDTASVYLCYPDATHKQVYWMHVKNDGIKRIAQSSPFHSTLDVHSYWKLQTTRYKTEETAKPQPQDYRSFQDLPNIMLYPGLRAYLYSSVHSNNQQYQENISLDTISLGAAIDKVSEMNKPLFWEIMQAYFTDKPGNPIIEELSTHKTGIQRVSAKSLNQNSMLSKFITAWVRWDSKKNRINRLWSLLLNQTKITYKFEDIPNPLPPGIVAPPTDTFEISSFPFDRLFDADIFVDLRGFLNPKAFLPSNYFELLVYKEILTFMDEEDNHTIVDLKFDYKLIHNQGGNHDFGQFDIMLTTRDGRLHIIECKTHKYDNKDLLANLKKARDLGGIYVSYICVIPLHPDDCNEDFVKYDIYHRLVTTMASQKIRSYYLSLDLTETPTLNMDSIELNSLRSYLNKFKK